MFPDTDDLYYELVDMEELEFQPAALGRTVRREPKISGDDPSFVYRYMALADFGFATFERALRRAEQEQIDFGRKSGLDWALAVFHASNFVFLRPQRLRSYPGGNSPTQGGGRFSTNRSDTIHARINF